LSVCRRINAIRFLYRQDARSNSGCNGELLIYRRSDHDYVANTACAAKLDWSRLINESSGFPWHGAGYVQDGHGGIDEPNSGQIMIVSESDPNPTLMNNKPADMPKK
jgi:hypothetical protein